MIRIPPGLVARVAVLVVILAVLAGCAHNAAGIATGHKPYTLQLRHGSNPELAQQWDPDTPPSAHYLDTAGKLDIDTAAVDAGRIALRGMVLDYQVEVAPGQGSARVDIDMARKRAGAQQALVTRLSLPLDQ